ncbi:hypothetical protein GTW25_02755 [Aliihoeflea aestuarii]|uniref:hypothetical protein n=1 Tax=Aliihoeflea aestuarii TaxID=453840 RepID=UPI002092E9A5|nr:hypothetical protein [Aliihoeflea aestuarii]MCO6389947.1 hypothetical protein [Aliihoeflea aestuarii]
MSIPKFFAGIAAAFAFGSAVFLALAFFAPPVGVDPAASLFSMGSVVAVMAMSFPLMALLYGLGALVANLIARIFPSLDMDEEGVPFPVREIIKLAVVVGIVVAATFMTRLRGGDSAATLPSLMSPFGSFTPLVLLVAFLMLVDQMRSMNNFSRNLSSKREDS